ncbi:uncharacterized protein EMH_0078510 [Eimeria mitis]|uniref:SAM domain-containing protein n=1 Tax=Eimeria mitis TaxID=44415 RepID=U6K588_9EIME|nr:uncharacterized protein EMH_0078510 [Eimeria mitis]CDJ32905.1 hypothetical protein, conserved [Eimeria mitis]
MQKRGGGPKRVEESEQMQESKQITEGGPQGPPQARSSSSSNRSSHSVNRDADRTHSPAAAAAAADAAAAATAAVSPLSDENREADDLVWPEEAEAAHWSPYELCCWLRLASAELRTQQLPAGFIEGLLERQIGGEEFLCLTAAQLKRDFGLGTFGGRNRVMMFVKLLRLQASRRRRLHRLFLRSSASARGPQTASLQGGGGGPPGGPSAGGPPPVSGGSSGGYNRQGGAPDSGVGRASISIFSDADEGAPPDGGPPPSGAPQPSGPPPLCLQQQHQQHHEQHHQQQQQQQQQREQQQQQLLLLLLAE